MKLKSAIQNLEPRFPFTISRGTKSSVDNVLVQLSQSGITGWGEAAPNRFYGEDAETVQSLLQKTGPVLQNVKIENPEDIANLWNEAWPLLSPSRAAQCALDVACWDLLARKNAMSLNHLIYKEPPEPLTSSVTAVLAPPDVWDQRIISLKGNPIIKVKMDASGSTNYLERITDHLPEVRLWVDANCALTPKRLQSLLPDLVELGVELLEQPLPPGTPLPPAIFEQQDLPIIADESCVTEEDVAKMAGQFHGINIKLSKCGGLTPALRMFEKARELDLQIMVGCMLESECLIAAGLAAAQNADYVDLDGSWLLKTKLFRGLNFDRGLIWVDDIPGLGINL